jgi:hypothetical protein
MKKVFTCLACLTVLFAFYATANGGVIAPVKLISQTPQVIQSPNAHTGQPAKNIVVLYPKYVSASSQSEFFRILPDGSTQPTSFKVPPGQLLVVTDVDWEATGNPGEFFRLRLFTKNPKLDTSSSDRRPVFTSSIILNSKGKGGTSESMTTGFVVSSDTIIEYKWLGDGSVGAVTLRGYLAPAN